jgi:S-adenosylmethionine-diacylgycerolhomoserine-N-methlytransferase
MAPSRYPKRLPCPRRWAAHGVGFLTQTAVQRFYRYHAYVYDSTRWLILHGRRRAVERLELRPDSQVLEIGCGTGLNFPYIMECLTKGGVGVPPATEPAGRLVGLDFSPDMLQRAARRVAARGWKNVELVQADAAKLALDRQFDAIFFGYSLTMIPDWRGALERAHAHLRPGGRVVVLDFGRFENWGPFGAVMRWWLRINHVDTLQPYEQTMRNLFGEARVESWFGGYNFTASARRRT